MGGSLKAILAIFMSFSFWWGGRYNQSRWSNSCCVKVRCWNPCDSAVLYCKKWKGWYCRRLHCQLPIVFQHIDMWLRSAQDFHATRCAQRGQSTPIGWHRGVKTNDVYIQWGLITFSWRLRWQSGQTTWYCFFIRAKSGFGGCRHRRYGARGRTWTTNSCCSSSSSPTYDMG